MEKKQKIKTRRPWRFCIDIVTGGSRRSLMSFVLGKLAQKAFYYNI